MEYRNHGLEEDTEETDSQDTLGNRLRVSDNKEVAQLSHSLAVAASRECSNISTINIKESSGVHIGPKIVSVVQNVDNNEKVKGRILGLELVTLSKRTRRLRCSVAVFLCWAFIVAVILTIFIVYLVLSAPPQRLDIGLNESWYFRRAQWQARDEYGRTELRTPVRTVIIGHSAETYCNQVYSCINVVLTMQEKHLRIWDDIGPNFLVGGKGLVFEGRGANLVGVMVKGYNNRIISIMFLGNYVVHEPDEEQFLNVGILLDVLVNQNILVPDYEVIGHCQISQTISPGAKIVERLKEFSHCNSSKIETCPR